MSASDLVPMPKIVAGIIGLESLAGTASTTYAACDCFQRCGGETWTRPCFIDNSVIVASDGPCFMSVA